LLIAVLVLVLLIVLNAFFAASEIALISLNDNKVKAMAEEGHKKAKLLQNLLSEPSRFLATIQIGITLAGFLASAFAAESFSGELADALYRLGIPLPVEILETLSLISITLILSYFTLVLGELVPKRIAMEKSEAISMFAVTPLTLLLKVASPFVKLLTMSTNTLVRIFGVDPNANNAKVTEEEIRMMVDVGQENGSIEEAEKRMINNVFEFNNKVASDIMTHRRNIVGIATDDRIEDIIDLVNQEKYTRLPVYKQSIDNIVGILHTKDLFQLIGQSSDSALSLNELVRKPFFVPEAKRTDELLMDMQAQKSHMAIVVDEYGGTAGIVTMEDLIEEIVGNIYDEYDEEEKDIETLGNHTFMANGQVNLQQLKAQLGIEINTEDYDTLSGFIIGELGRIPDDRERPSIEYSGYAFTVEEVVGTRIQKVQITKMQNQI